MRSSKFCWCETGRRHFVSKNNFDESVIAEFDTYEEAKEFGKTRYPDDEDYGIFKYDEGKLYRYSDACGQLQRKEEVDALRDWETVKDGTS